MCHTQWGISLTRDVKMCWQCCWMLIVIPSLKTSQPQGGEGGFLGMWNPAMDRSALGNLLAEAVHFICEVELLQNQKMLQSQENSVSQKQKCASVTRIRRKQWLMYFGCENPSFAGTVWRERAWWRNAERVEKQLEARDKNKITKYNIVHRIWKAYRIWHTEISVFWWCQKKSGPENMKCERERRRWLQHFWDPGLKG